MSGGTQPTLTLSGEGGECLGYISGAPPFLLAQVIDVLDKLRYTFAAGVAQVLLFFQKRIEADMFAIQLHGWNIFVCVVGELSLVLAFG